MSGEDISTVVLASFDQSQSDDVKKFKGAIQESQGAEVLEFSDVKKQYAKIPSYPEKLKLVLDRAKLAILITPGDVSVIEDNAKLLELIKAVHKIDDEAAKTFLEFVDIESKNSTNSKLVFCSFGGEDELPAAYGHVEHAKNMMVESEVNRDELTKILTKCKRPARATFPEGSSKKGSKKKDDCQVM